MYTILLVEDDAALTAAIREQLGAYGHTVKAVTDFNDVTGTFLREKSDLVLMDVMLPKRDGYYWCGEIRKLSSVPVVFLSSASENMSIVMAVSMGGDDFIPKPADPMVLAAKVNAALRRAYEMGAEQRLVEWNGALVNLSDNTVRTGSGTAELTRNEFRILETLLLNRGKIVSRDALMLRLWQDDCYVEENTLTQNVARLRKKLEECGLTDAIVTKPGSGYMVR